MANNSVQRRAWAHILLLPLKCCYTSPLLLLALILHICISFDPSFSIHSVRSIPQQTVVANSPTTDSNYSVVFFDLKLENPNLKGVRYGAIKLTFYSGANRSTSGPIGTCTLPGFYQGKEREARQRDVAVAPWGEAAIVGAEEGIRVDLETRVKFKNLFWYSKKKRIVVGGRVEVDDSGMMNVGTKKRKTVKLVRSGKKPPVEQSWFWVFILLLAFCCSPCCLIPIICYCGIRRQEENR